jgi:hypothetical protein
MVGLFFLVALIAIIATALRFTRSKSILDHWAESNGYEIISREHRFLRVGPFWWRKTDHQEVYYVTVRTPEGQTRRGWVRCGGWFLGLWSDSATVEWDE